MPRAGRTVDVRIASPRYFETLGIPLRRGRTFTQSDDREDAARRGHQRIDDALLERRRSRRLTHRVWRWRQPRWVTVVGVVGNVRQFALERDAEAQVYCRWRSRRLVWPARVMVRVTGNPLDSARLIREEVRALDPNLPVENVQTLEALRSRALATPGLTAVLLSIFACVALAVTLAGIAGIIAMSVTQRTPEFGLRMALGASRGNVLRLVLGQGVMLVGVGLVVGIPLSVALGRVVSSSLFALPRASALTVAVVATMFLLTAVLACLGPARRATKVDPILALRAE